MLIEKVKNLLNIFSVNQNDPNVHRSDVRRSEIIIPCSESKSQAGKAVMADSPQ